MSYPIEALKREAEEAKETLEKRRQQHAQTIDAGRRAQREVDDARRVYEEIREAVGVLESAEKAKQHEAEAS